MKKILFIVLCNIFGSPLFANAKSTAVFGVSQELPGIIEEDDNEKIVGPLFERVQNALKKANLPENMAIYPWPRAYEMAKKNKNYYIFPIAKNEEREKHFIFVGVVFNINTYLYQRSLNDIKIKSLEDAKKYSLCVVRNDVRDQYLIKKGFTNIIRFADQESMVNGLNARKCDLAICAENIEFIWKKSLKEKIDGQIKKVFLVKDIDPKRYLAFNKDSDKELIDKFTLVLKDMKIEIRK